MFNFWQLISSTASASTFMPTQGSAVAAQVDKLYMFLLIASAIACVLVIGGLIYFALKYMRKSDNDKTAYISHNNKLEFLWSFIPFVLFMIIFGWGWHIYHQMKSYPENALEVHVYGQKWFWDFKYKSGRKTTNEFFVPVDTPVKLIMTSNDVIHSFFIPSMRIKQDVVPGRYTALWFQPAKLGDFQIFCTEFCGDQHSGMLAKVHVLPKEEYETWIASDPFKGLSLVEIGKKTFEGKCTACHNISSEPKVGPGFAGIFGKTREFVDGSSTVADENYIRQSILNPNSRVVKGFPAAMTPFQGIISEEEITGIIEYFKTLK